MNILNIIVTKYKYITCHIYIYIYREREREREREINEEKKKLMSYVSKANKKKHVVKGK